MTRNDLKPGTRVKHFKGDLYEVIAVATDAEWTTQETVIPQSWCGAGVGAHA